MTTITGVLTAILMLVSYFAAIALGGLSFVVALDVFFEGFRERPRQQRVTTSILIVLGFCTSLILLWVSAWAGAK